MTLTDREKRAIACAAIAAWCLWPRKRRQSWVVNTAGYVAVGLLASDAISWATDAHLFSNPDTMNAFFRTGGKVTGKGDDQGAKLVRKTGVVES